MAVLYRFYSTECVALEHLLKMLCVKHLLVASISNMLMFHQKFYNNIENLNSSGVYCFWCISAPHLFFQNSHFQQNLSRIPSKPEISLDMVHFVRHNMGLNCLPKVSTDDKSY